MRDRSGALTASFGRPGRPCGAAVPRIFFRRPSPSSSSPGRARFVPPLNFQKKWPSTYFYADHGPLVRRFG